MIRLVVLGDPIAHSRSPAIHTAALRFAGLAGTYEARRVDVAGLREAADEIRDGRLTGANITMPHKRLAAELADYQTGLVRRIGAANTWWRLPDDRLAADNSDVAGVRFAYGRIGASERGASPRTLVLGAGGAAAAALVACEDHELHISARQSERARALVDRLSIAASIVPWGDPLPGAVIVNATRLGMNGEPLPFGLLSNAEGLIDMPYGDRPTPAVAAATAKGLPLATGLDMLVGQAIASFRTWTGRVLDPIVFEQAATGDC